MSAAVCMVLVTGEGMDDQPIFAYVTLRCDRLAEFMDAQAAGTLYPDDFGVVIESGEGEPSPELRQKMETEWGFRHDGLPSILDADHAQALAEAVRTRTE